MRRLTLITAILLAVTTPASAQMGYEPVVLAPTSDWVLDYGDEYCGLVRRFGEGADETVLQLANYGSRNSYRVMILGARVPRGGDAVEQLGLRFGTMPEFAEIYAFMSDSDGSRGAAFPMAFRSPEAAAADAERMREDPTYQIARDPEFERSVVRWEMDFGDREVELQSGSMKPVLDAMLACRDDMLTSWGIDPAVQNTLSRQPKPRPQTIGRIQRTYPRDMISRRQSAFVPFRAIVDEAGNMESCVIQSPSPDPDFDSTVCEGLALGFEPALDAAGNPVRSVVTSSVVYRVGR